MNSTFNSSLIDSYLQDFQGQIFNTKKDYYVIYHLDNDYDVNGLSELLENPYIVNYIINITYQQPFYTDINIKNNSYINQTGTVVYPSKEWYLMITGFKYGARKNSQRKLGLVAYDPYHQNPPNFISYIFYDSFSFNNIMYYNLGFHINNIVMNENYYLQNYHDNVYVPYNYIKETAPKKKKSPSKKKVKTPKK